MGEDDYSLTNMKLLMTLIGEIYCERLKELAMGKLKGSEEVIVITDHSPCLETIPPQAPKYGYEVDIKETGKPEWTITLIPKGEIK